MWNSITPTTLRDFAANITRRFDKDGDGRLSVDEFGAVLTGVLRGDAATLTGPGGPSLGAPAATFVPKHSFEGFDFAREQNPAKSAKDAFAYLANQAPPPPFADKAALGTWFTQHIAPGMDHLGHRVNYVTGDKFSFTNWQGTFEVDFVRGAGAAGAALAWQVAD